MLHAMYKSVRGIAAKLARAAARALETPVCQPSPSENRASAHRREGMSLSGDEGAIGPLQKPSERWRPKGFCNGDAVAPCRQVS